jgi:hypothetical protein
VYTSGAFAWDGGHAAHITWLYQHRKKEKKKKRLQLLASIKETPWDEIHWASL